MLRNWPVRELSQTVSSMVHDISISPSLLQSCQVQLAAGDLDHIDSVFNVHIMFHIMSHILCHICLQLFTDVSQLRFEDASWAKFRCSYWIFYHVDGYNSHDGPCSGKDLQ